MFPRCFDQEGWSLPTYNNEKVIFPRVTYFGVFKSHGGFKWEQISPYYCLHLIFGGKGYFIADKKSYYAEEGDAFLFFPGMHIFYYDESRSPWKYIWLRMDGNSLESILKQTGFTRQSPLLTQCLNSELRTTLYQMQESLRHNDYSLFTGESLFWWTIDNMLRTKQKVNRQPDFLFVCKSLFENQYSPPLSVNWLAKYFQLSRSQFFRIFRHYYGVSPKKYLNHYQFDKARELLQTTNLPVKEIAYNCGFSSPNYFVTAFKKRFGVVPSVWRERIRSESLKERISSDND